MSAEGKAPLEPDTLVGQLRVQLGDTQYSPLDPPIAGYGEYAVYSDLALEAALAQASDSIPRAAGNLTLTLAMSYSAKGKSIQTDDLQIDIRSRGRDLLEVAKAFFAEADTADAAGANDFFEIVPFGGRSGRGGVVRPEATPWPL